MSVKVSYDDLGDLSTQLKSIIDEFEHAGSRRRDLESAVDRPYDLGDLKDAAHEFEGRWDDRRKRLMDSCKGLAEHVDGVIKGFQGFDEEAANRTGER